jgi:hypothetical protein
VHTPLDALARLQDVATTVDAALVSLQDANFDISAFFVFLKGEYPCIRRIAFAQHEPRKERLVSAHSCEHDMILWDPWDRADFVEILKDALACRLRPTRSTWTDLRLFESFRGADGLAIAEIVRRYRHRIVRLALDATHNTTDTEDIVQDVYLAIVQHLPFFGRVCSPGHWIDRVTCKTIRSFFHRETRKASP